MARHRKIDVRMWGDAKFRALSAPQPNGQTLWVYLLTGPHTTSIPGLFVAGESALAEALRWPLKGFREAFREALTQGMAEADFSARVIWIPKAIFYNPPESKNVVKSWRAYWDEIPECGLKHKAHQHLKGFLEGLGEGWAQEFDRACANPSPNQEQEQEQEQDTPLSPPKGGNAAREELTVEAFLKAWNSIPQFVHARAITGNRLKHFQSRRKSEDWATHWREALELAASRPFCLGMNDRGWRATVEWFLRPETVTKILEGWYTSNGKGPPPRPPETREQRDARIKREREEADRVRRQAAPMTSFTEKLRERK